MSDYYETLGVDPDASQSEIEEAFRERVKETHPDQSDHPNAAQLFMQVKEAYDILSDPEQRSEYDTRREPSGRSNTRQARNEQSQRTSGDRSTRTQSGRSRQRQQRESNQQTGKSQSQSSQKDRSQRSQSGNSERSRSTKQADRDNVGWRSHTRETDAADPIWNHTTNTSDKPPSPEDISDSWLKEKASLAGVAVVSTIIGLLFVDNFMSTVFSYTAEPFGMMNMGLLGFAVLIVVLLVAIAIYEIAIGTHRRIYRL